MNSTKSDTVATELAAAFEQNIFLGVTEISTEPPPGIPDYLRGVDHFGRCFGDRLEDGFRFLDGDTEPARRNLRLP